MNLGFDYDGTYTSDPELWLPFIEQAIFRGHHVFLVTMRFPSEMHDLDERLLTLLRKQPFPCLVSTARQAKAPACAALGVEIHVWIDDNPRAVNESAVDIWGTVSPEGHVVVPEYNKD